MNKERILALADMIEASATFRMNTEANRKDDNVCGTPACLIGHANAARLTANGADPNRLSYRELVSAEGASKWLGFGYDEPDDNGNTVDWAIAEPMFYPDHWNSDGGLYHFDPLKVAAALRKFAETGDPADLDYQPEYIGGH